MVCSDTHYDWQVFCRWVTSYQKTRFGVRNGSRTALIAPTHTVPKLLCQVRNVTELLTPRPIPNIRPLPASCSQLIQVKVKG